MPTDNLDSYLISTATSFAAKNLSISDIWSAAGRWRSNSSVRARPPLESPVALRCILLPDELYGDDSENSAVRPVIRMRKLLAQSAIVGQVCFSA